jgi:hypothetical protein
LRLLIATWSFKPLIQTPAENRIHFMLVSETSKTNKTSKTSKTRKASKKNMTNKMSKTI